jgi:ATP-dependent helicase HepA
LLGRQFNDKENSLLAAEETDEGYLYRQSLLNELVDRHGTSRVLFRNSRNAISGFPGRKLFRHPLSGTNPLFAVAEWLPRFLSEVYPEKVLLILSARESLELIAEQLRKAGVDSAQFHEGMSIVERDRAAAWFADADDGAQILLCSEIGSEGRNFQFLHHLVTLELPLRPDVLEQRIGRLDRIGQRHEVQVHIPVLVNSRDDRLLRWYDEGLNAIEHICRVGDTVFSEVKNDLIRILEQEQPDALALDQLVQQTGELAQIYNERLESGRDRLLELNSNRIDLVEEHLDLMHREERSYTLPDFMNRVFDCFGLDNEEQSNGSWIVKPTDHMQIASFPGIDADGITLTYSRSQALEREDFAYLTWDHPMVTAGMDLVLNEATGQVNAQVIDTELLPKGVLYLEAVTTFACSADKSLRIDRYFPSGTRRFLLGSNRKDYSSVLHRLDFDSMIRRTDRSKIKKLVQDSRPSITMLLNH